MGRFSMLGIFWFTAWFAANLGVLVFARHDESWYSLAVVLGLLTFAVISSISMDRGYFEVAEPNDSRHSQIREEKRQ